MIFPSRALPEIPEAPDGRIRLLPEGEEIKRNLLNRIF
jgi:hypothetical protein